MVLRQGDFYKEAFVLENDNQRYLDEMPQRVVDGRYHILSEFDRARIDDGFYAVCPESHAMHIANRTRGRSVLDACSGLGGLTIAYARAGKSVLSAEIDHDRQLKAKHNAKVYEVDGNISWLEGDVTQLDNCSGLRRGVDTVFFDPPWGSGPSGYRKADSIALENLSLGQVDLRDLIEQIPCRNVVIRVPNNFAFDGLGQGFRGDIIEYQREFGEDFGKPMFSCIFTDRKNFLTIPRLGLNL